MKYRHLKDREILPMLVRDTGYRARPKIPFSVMLNCLFPGFKKEKGLRKGIFILKKSGADDGRLWCYLEIWTRAV